MCKSGLFHNPLLADYVHEQYHICNGNTNNECMYLLYLCLSQYLFLRDHLHLLVHPGLLLLALALGLQHLQQLLDALVPGAQRLLLGVYPHLQLLVTVRLYTYK